VFSNNCGISTNYTYIFSGTMMSQLLRLYLLFPAMPAEHRCPWAASYMNEVQFIELAHH